MRWPTTQSTILRGIREWDNQEAWKTFVDVYAPLLYRACRRHHLQDSDAADVVQNVLTRVWRAAASFDQQRGRFRNWLITITSREIYRYQRRRAATQNVTTLTETEIEQSLTAEWVVEFQTRLFEFAMERVSRDFDPTMWHAFEQVWIEQRKAQEVAAQLGKDVQWVYRTKRQVLERLRAEVTCLENDASLLAQDVRHATGKNNNGQRQFDARELPT